MAIAACQLLRSRHQLFLRINSVYKTDTVCFVRFDVAGRIYHLLCLARSDETCESLCTAEAWSDTKTYFRLSESCVVRADTDITAHGKLVAAAERETVYCRDNWNRESFDLAENIVAEFTEVLALLLGHRCS